MVVFSVKSYENTYLKGRALYRGVLIMNGVNDLCVSISAI